MPRRTKKSRTRNRVHGPELPTELHDAITRQLSDKDLCNYRLACKRFADIGAKELFRTVVFHASSDSIGRIQALARHDIYSKFVQAIVWDTNLWDVGAYEFSMFAAAYSPYWNNKVDYSDFERYLELRSDESKQLHGALQSGLGEYHRLGPLLLRFASLTKIYIINGHFDCRDRLVRKYGMFVPAPRPGEPIKRGVALHNKHLEDGLIGVRALRNATDAIGVCETPFRKLRVDAVDFRFFLPGFIEPGGFGYQCRMLTSLKLKMSTPVQDDMLGLLWRDERNCRRTMQVGLLKEFLGRLNLLESLSIDFGKLDDDPYKSCSHPGAADLGDIFPLERRWTSLKKLSLSFVDTSEELFIRIIRNHALTLRKLRLCGVRLEREGFWIRVFQTLQPELRLESASFQYYLASSVDNNKIGLALWVAWDVNGRLGRKLAAYLVHGGECPLNIKNHGLPESETLDDQGSDSDSSSMSF